MDAEQKQSKGRKITSRLAYSFGAFGHDAFYATLSTYFIMFVTSHLFDKSSGAQGTQMIMDHHDYCGLAVRGTSN